MFNERQTANIELKDGIITVKNRDLSMSFNYSSITYLYINNELDESAPEQEVSLKKLRRSESNLADLLRMNFAVNGVSLSFVVNKSEGEPLALYVENEFRRRIASADIVPGSIADVLNKELAEEDPNEAVYPIYFHGCRSFSDDQATEI